MLVALWGCIECKQVKNADHTAQRLTTLACPRMYCWRLADEPPYQCGGVPCLSLSLPPNLKLFAYVLEHISIYLFIYLSSYLSIYQSIYLVTYLSIYLSICGPVSPPICPLIHPFAGAPGVRDLSYATWYAVAGLLLCPSSSMLLRL